MDFKSNFPPKAMAACTTIQMGECEKLRTSYCGSFLKKL